VYARAEALGHDMHRRHYVIVAQIEGGAELHLQPPLSRRSPRCNWIISSAGMRGWLS
jgi:hypothetical protein